MQNDNQPTNACYCNTPTATVLSKTLACVFDSEVVAIRSYNARQFTFELPTTVCNLKLAPRFHQGKSGHFIAKSTAFPQQAFCVVCIRQQNLQQKRKQENLLPILFFCIFFATKRHVFLQRFAPISAPRVGYFLYQ